MHVRNAPSAIHTHRVLAFYDGVCAQCMRSTVAVSGRSMTRVCASHAHNGAFGCDTPVLTSIRSRIIAKVMACQSIVVPLHTSCAPRIDHSFLGPMINSKIKRLIPCDACNLSMLHYFPRFTIAVAKGREARKAEESLSNSHEAATKPMKSSFAKFGHAPCKLIYCWATPPPPPANSEF